MIEESTHDSCDEDVALMARIAQGDQRAMEELITKYKDAIYATASRMLNQSAEAEDIAQQLFIRVWKHAPAYDPLQKFSTWMFTILRNLVFNELRRNRRRPTISTDSIEEENGITLSVDNAPTPDQSTLNAELEHAVDAALQSLAPNAQMAMQMIRFQQSSYQEIAQVLGISMPAVKSLIFRARNELKAALAEYLDR